MKDWVKLEDNKYAFYFQRKNIAGVCIDKNRPLELSILMIGDEMPTMFSFETNQLRNDKLDEIFEREKTENETLS